MGNASQGIYKLDAEILPVLLTCNMLILRLFVAIYILIYPRIFLKSLKNQPFEILAVNVADTGNRIHEFIKRMDLHLTILMDHDGETFKAWQGKVLPASFLLDRSGRIRYQVIGPVEWDSDEAVAIIEQLLRQQ